MMLELCMTVASYVILVVMVLVGVAFVTLMEQKILAHTQIRVGPNYSGPWGLFQPFADAVKLFNKETTATRTMSVKVYHLSPSLNLSLALSLWLVYPFMEGGVDLVYGLLFFMCVSGMSVYPILACGWSSNCKYSMLGSLRAVAQMISYEASMAVVLLSLVWLSESFSFFMLLDKQYLAWNIFLAAPLSYVWTASMLAETQRTPYDFSEGESELVSGFNTEYSSGGFTLVFMSEYSSILLMSLVFSLLFLGSSFSSFTLVKSALVSFGFVWVRATLPRYRYDKLMALAWKSFLPASLFFFFYYLMVGSAVLFS
uniref:NADH dehydrogenase subunit 1 n=1 Tax=Macrohectopus branickii TaxID=65455 RepID=UPI001D11997C|nr:NADH dehydrogenase subunit 1 [Macrohectopus branickii]UCL27458.1 NADH dehydrogenase subunit 1 [Macrohectopus branickii]